MSKRRILTTFIFPILLVSLLIIVLVNNQPESYGLLELSEERIDFGTVPEWKGQVTQTFFARNTGKKTINIQNIQTGCSYAEINGPKTIQPDSAGTFNIILNPQYLPDNETTTTAILFTDSPKTPQLYLTIVAKARRFASLSADICDFGEILPEISYEKHIRLCVNEPLNTEEIRLLPPDYPMLTWKLLPDSEENYFNVTIQLKMSMIGSHIDVFNPVKHDVLFSTLLTIAFPNKRTLTLPVTARILKPVNVVPESLSFGVVNTGINPSLQFTLSSKRDFQVVRIQMPKYIKVVDISKVVKLETDSSHYQKKYEVTWDVENSPILLREEMQITTSATITPIRIPIYGYIQAETPSDQDE
ncbi:hypothetical protein C6497_13095 [Candidatus Poribacteria bacterium]|nr:MAG: hypothetical protein C6497_13095 [Candidatus Poribacteria bacterium]